MKYLKRFSSFLLFFTSYTIFGQEIVVIDMISQFPLEGVTIYHKTKNISDSESFIDFVGYNEIEENTLSFIYDSEKINKIPLSATLICTYKKANELCVNQIKKYFSK